MDALKIEAFKVVLFILPGIITLRIRAALAISSPSKPLNAAIDGAILTLIDHAAYGFCKWVLTSFFPGPWLAGAGHFLGGLLQSVPPEWGRQFSQAGGFAIIVIAVGVGFVAGVMRYRGWDFRLLRSLGATNRTGENLLWAETLTKLPRDSYAVVACKDGSRFMGVIDLFSEEAGNYEVSLARASQVQPDGTLLPIKGRGVLLTRENAVIRIEFWDAKLNGVVGGQGNA